MRNRPNATICFLITLALLAMPPAVRAEYGKKVLVKSGDPAPGTDAAIFNLSDWNPPTSIGISLAGDVLFRGELESGVGDVNAENYHGIWVYEPSVDAIRLVIRPGDEVPVLGGAIFLGYDLKYTSMDVSGNTGLLASYVDGADTISAFFMEWRGTSGTGTLFRKVWEGMEVLPDMPGVFIANFTPVAFNGEGLLFWARVEGAGITLNQNDLVLCMFSIDGIYVIAQKLEPMPLIGNDYTLKSVTSDMEGQPLNNFYGAVVQLVGAKFLEPDIRAVYYWDVLGSFVKLAFSHQDTTKVIFGGSRLNSFNTMLRAGHVQSLGKSIIWVGPLGTVGGNTIVTQGDVADGADGASFNTFIDFVLFDDSSIALNSQLSDGRLGIWMGNETGMEKVAMVGDTVHVGDTTAVLTLVNRMMANRSGLVAFGDMADDGYLGLDGIWAGNTLGLDIVSIRNQMVALDTNDARTIWDHYTGHIYRTRTGADGYSALLNDSGKIAYGVTFSEGGNALILGSPGAIVVNSNGDASDADSSDGICATGVILPSGKPECTMRAAISEANFRPGHNTITFDIEDEDTWIFPESPLPAITESVEIDASTQPAPDTIVLHGQFAPAGTNGLTLEGENITIKGMFIGGFDGDGLRISGFDRRTVGSNAVYGCHIGWTDDIGINYGNSGDGIEIYESDNNIIGGPENWQRNFITKNTGNGVCVAYSQQNKIINNVIGGAAGDTAGGNLGSGVLINNLSNANVVGGVSDSGNVISGNNTDGVGIYFSDYTEIRGNTIYNNYNGILIGSHGFFTGITNNVIGINELGQADGNRQYGIRIENMSDSNVVGGNKDRGNVISANESGGVRVFESDDNLIGGNYIGVNAAGTEAVANHGCGVVLENCYRTIIGKKLVDISITVGDGNVISGNDSAGVKVFGRCYGTIITSNIIGASADDATSIPNYWGITVSNSPGTYIGHSGQFTAGFGNIIRTNKKTGIILSSDSCSVVSSVIESNGSGAVPLGGDGIYIDGGYNQIGDRDLGNEFNLNFGAAVRVVDDSLHDNNANTIQYNRMFNNTKGGIELLPEGINIIDDLDLDDGPNTGQNAPRFVSAVYTLNKYLLLKGVLHSRPNQTYHVMVHKADVCVEIHNLPNAGLELLYDDFVTTDGSGDALIDISDGPLNDPVPGALVMNVTDADGNTSEFSNCALVWDQLDGVDLVVTKTDNADSAAVPDTLRYDIIVTNMGSLTANNVILTDSLPPLVTHVSDSSDHGPCLFSDGLLTCNLGTMMPFDEAKIYLAVATEEYGVIKNAAIASSSENDADPASNTAIDSTISSEDYTDVDEDADDNDSQPYTFDLSQNYPNPFNPTTKITYTVPTCAHVSITVYNLLGQEVKHLIDSDKGAGTYTIIWDGKDDAGRPVSTGIYMYRFRADNHVETKKMLLLK